MNKIARKPSTDPVQEKLRLNKSEWNKEVSLFIDNLIHFKKMVNGTPSKFNQTKSNIKDPIPSDPVTIVGVLANDFSEIAQRGNLIINEQLQYSKNRRKKKVENSGSEINHKTSSLQLEASNKLTRFFSRLKGPWLGSSPERRTRQYRLSLLNIAADLNKDFSDLESTIVSSTPESIFVSSKLIDKIEDGIYSFIKNLSAFVDNDEKPKELPAVVSPEKLENKKDSDKSKQLDQSKQPDQSKQKSKTEDDLIDRANAVKIDFNTNKSNFLDLESDLEKMTSAAIKVYNNSLTPVDKINNAKSLISVYEALLLDLNAKRGTNAASLGEILLAKKAYLEIQVLAGNFFSKWLGKTKHQLSLFDKTSATRLEIFNKAKSSRNDLNSILNSLEKSLTPEIIEPLIKKIAEDLLKIKELIKPLEVLAKGKRINREFINLLESGKITEYPVNMSSKEKEDLSRFLKTRELRDLTKMRGK